MRLASRRRHPSCPTPSEKLISRIGISIAVLLLLVAAVEIYLVITR